MPTLIYEHREEYIRALQDVDESQRGADARSTAEHIIQPDFRAGGAKPGKFPEAPYRIFNDGRAPSYLALSGIWHLDRRNRRSGKQRTQRERGRGSVCYRRRLN